MLISTSKIVALCSLSNLINTADRALMPIAIVHISREYEFTLRQQAYILSSYPFGYLTSQIIGANLSKQYGGKNILLLSVLLWSLITFLTPVLASSSTLLIVSRAILGALEGVSLPAIINIYSTCVLNDERSRAFSYLISFGSIGQTIVALICPNLKWINMFLLFGSLGFVWCFIWILTFKRIFNKKDDYLIMKTLASTPQANRSFKEYFKYSPLICIYLAHFSMNFTSHLITTWLPTYLSKIFSLTQSTLSLTALPYVFNSVFGIFVGHLADVLIQRKWSILSVRRLMTCVGLVGPSVCILLFIYVNNLPMAIFLISLCMGLIACNSCGHLANHLDIAPTHSSITFSISNTLAYVPGILLGPLLAYIVHDGRWFPIFLIAIAINLLASVCYQLYSTSTQIFY